MIIEERLQRALERIYADPALTDALRDPEATVLLNWAQQQAQCLVAETDTLDEEVAWSWLNPRLRRLRRTVRRIAQHSGDAEVPLDAVRRRLSLLSALREEAVDDEN
jgi:HAMP domain-containing protein